MGVINTNISSVKIPLNLNIAESYVQRLNPNKFIKSKPMFVVGCLFVSDLYTSRV